MKRKHGILVGISTLAVRHALSFHIAAPAAGTQTALQQRPQPYPTNRQHQLRLSKCAAAIRTSAPNASRGRRNGEQLAAVEDGGEKGGGGGEGFSPPQEKVSRRSAKKAKARGGAPAIPTKKAPPGEPSQEVSKALVAEVISGQTAGRGASSDQLAAR